MQNIVLYTSWFQGIVVAVLPTVDISQFLKQNGAKIEYFLILKICCISNNWLKNSKCYLMSLMNVFSDSVTALQIAQLILGGMNLVIALLACIFIVNLAKKHYTVFQ